MYQRTVKWLKKIALADTGFQSTFAPHSLLKIQHFYGIRLNSVR